MRRLLAVIALLVVGALALGATRSGAERSGLRLHKVGTFDQPVYVTAPPGDRHRVFVVEQTGRIRVVRDGRTLAAPFLDIRSQTRFGREQGLFSMAFAPDYATSRRFYVFYTSEDGKQHITEFRAASATRADPASGRDVLVEDDPAPNHNGGQLQFGPDGRLYIANGDGGGGELALDALRVAQDPNSPFGKVLRVDPLGGKPPEVYLSGLRNPWRFSFDRKTGALIVTDVGTDQQDEVDYFTPGQGQGANLGWPAYEGRKRTASEVAVSGAVRPVLVEDHSAGGFCAITGGYVSRDAKVPATKGRYLFGDFCRGDVFSSRLRQPDSTARDTGLHVPALVSFGEDGRARVYVVSKAGPVYRIVARG